MYQSFTSVENEWIDWNEDLRRQPRALRRRLSKVLYNLATQYCWIPLTDKKNPVIYGAVEACPLWVLAYMEISQWGPRRSEYQ